MKQFMQKFISLLAQGMINGAAWTATGGESRTSTYVF